MKSLIAYAVVWLAQVIGAGFAMAHLFKDSLWLFAWCIGTQLFVGWMLGTIIGSKCYADPHS